MNISFTTTRGSFNGLYPVSEHRHERACSAGRFSGQLHIWKAYTCPKHLSQLHFAICPILFQVYVCTIIEMTMHLTWSIWHYHKRKRYGCRWICVFVFTAAVKRRYKVNQCHLHLLPRVFIGRAWINWTAWTPGGIRYWTSWSKGKLSLEGELCG